MAYRVTPDLQRAVATIVPAGGPTGPASYWGFWIGNALGDTDFLVRAQYDSTGARDGSSTKTADFSALFGAAWGTTVQFNLVTGLSWLRTSIIRAGGDGVGHGALVFLVPSTLAGAAFGTKHIVVWDAENGTAYAYTTRGQTMARWIESTGKLHWFEGEVVGSQYRVLHRSSNRKLGGVSTVAQTALQTLAGGATFVSVGAGALMTGKRRVAFNGGIIHYDDVATVLGNDTSSLWAPFSGSFSVENFSASSSTSPDGLAHQASNNPVDFSTTRLREWTEESDPIAASNIWPGTGTWQKEVAWRVVSVSGDGLEAALYDAYSAPNGARIVRDTIGGSHGASPATDITLAVGPSVPELGTPPPPDAAYIRT